MIIGILGGIASGKSTVATFLGEEGCRTIDADRIGHEILRKPRVRDSLRKRFGDDILDRNGEIDRRALGAKAFGPPGTPGTDAVAALNAVTHPPIEERIRSIIEQHLGDVSSGRVGFPASILALDVALLASSTLLANCDALIFVDAPLGERQRRARRRGWSNEELQRREAHQKPLESKRALATWRVDTSGALAETRARVVEILREIERGAPNTASASGPTATSPQPKSGPADA